MTNLAEDKETEDDGNKDDWGGKDKENKKDGSEDDSNGENTKDQIENKQSTNETVSKPEDVKPSGKFVPRHLRGGDSSGPSLNTPLINQGLRGPGGRFQRVKEPPKTESHSEFPTSSLFKMSDF